MHLFEPIREKINQEGIDRAIGRFFVTVNNKVKSMVFCSVYVVFNGFNCFTKKNFTNLFLEQRKDYTECIKLNEPLCYCQII
jgi:hypothetical protein